MHADDEAADDSQDWMNAVERGGLMHVNNDTYELFLSMEKELRNYIKSPNPPTFTKQVMNSISQTANVQFFWYLISSDWEENRAKALLEMIIEEWVTLRGFSYASAWVEKFKAKHKKTTQKSKGVRKQLIPRP